MHRWSGRGDQRQGGRPGADGEAHHRAPTQPVTTEPPAAQPTTTTTTTQPAAPPEQRTSAQDRCAAARAEADRARRALESGQGGVTELLDAQLAAADADARAQQACSDN